MVQYSILNQEAIWISCAHSVNLFMPAFFIFIEIQNPRISLKKYKINNIHAMKGRVKRKISPSLFDYNLRFPSFIHFLGFLGFMSLDTTQEFNHTLRFIIHQRVSLMACGFKEKV